MIILNIALTLTEYETILRKIAKTGEYKELREAGAEMKKDIVETYVAKKVRDLIQESESVLRTYKDYEPWRYARKSTCKNCGQPIYYSSVDTVWLHYDFQYFCDGEYGRKDRKHAEREGKDE